MCTAVAAAVTSAADEWIDKVNYLLLDHIIMYYDSPLAATMDRSESLNYSMMFDAHKSNSLLARSVTSTPNHRTSSAATLFFFVC